MLSLTASQQAIVADIRSAKWLFEVTDNLANVYHWAFEALTWEGQPYSFGVIPKTFAGITINRARSEKGVQAPNNLTFTATNKNNTLDAADFKGGSVLVRLICGNSTGEEEIVAVRFSIRICKAVEQTLLFTCQDFLSIYLDGDYPLTPLVRDLAISDDVASDDLCVPRIFGTAYIPIRSIYITDQRYYLLGDAAYNYTVSEVSSPRDFPGKSTWGSADFTFSQSSKTLNGHSYKVSQFIIADSDGDGEADANGLWKSGDRFLDALVKLASSETSEKTGLEEAIELFAKDIGVPAAWIDTGAGSSFESAGATLSGRGLTINGGWFRKVPRNNALALLKNQGHVALDVLDKIYLRCLSASPVATIDKSNVNRKNGKVGGNFKVSAINTTVSDAGYCAFQESGKPQDILPIKIQVPAKASNDNISNDVLLCPFVQNSVNVRKLTCLWLQRKYLPDGRVNVPVYADLLAVQPDDVVTVDHADYGGTYDALVDQVSISRELDLDFVLLTTSASLDDWDDLNFDAVVVPTEDSTVYWTTVSSGPDTTSDVDGSAPNMLVGKMRIGPYGGNYMLFDGDDGITCVDLILGQTVRIPTDGSAPIFASGILQEMEYQIYTSGVIKTSSNPVSAGGWLVNNIRQAAYTPTGLKVFEVVFGGTDYGDFYVGDYDSGNHGLKYDHSAGTFLFRGAGTFSGALSAATGTFAGELSAATGTFAGSLSAATGTFSGTVTIGAGSSGVSNLSDAGDLAVLDVVGSAQIDSLAVTEAKIGSLAVTEGKIGSLAVTEGKIGSLSVSTLKIADNAVNVPVAAYTASSTSVDTSYTTIQSASITISDAPAGGCPIFLSFCAGWANSKFHQYKILRGSTTVMESFDNFIGSAIAGSIVDTVADGSYTYYLQLKFNSGSDDVGNRSLMIQGVKK